MKSYYNQDKISSGLTKFFQKIFSLSKPLINNLSFIITGMISAESDNKIHISFDHMFCKDKFTILLFSLRIGKQRHPSLVSLF